MQIKRVQISIRDLVKEYSRNETTGRVVGYGGALDIRPAYQREFVYDDKQRNAVIDTVRNGFPLNTIYWAVTSNGFEVLDGQQRTISICEYIEGEYSIKEQYFYNLTKEEQDEILDYQLDVYQCEGTDKEKLDWFKIVNIAGAVLTDQELRNAVYAGPFTGAAKKKFSARGCSAESIAKQFLSGTQIRQDYLETALQWVAYKNNTTIENYMALHQYDENCDELWEYFEAVIKWVGKVFPVYRKEMKGLPWGEFFKDYGLNENGETIYPSISDDAIKALMTDDDVTKKGGIFEYLLSGRKKEKALSVRAFSDTMKRGAYERQNRKCAICGKECEYEKMHGDHIKPWSMGGHTTADNLQMLCTTCNLNKKADC